MVPCIIQHFNKINFLDENIQIKFKSVSSKDRTGTKRFSFFKKNKIANHILSNSEKQTSPQENTAQQLAFECDTEEFHLANYKIKKKTNKQQHPTKSTDKRKISYQQILSEVPQTSAFLTPFPP